jgi:alpha-beta hydrolase superfamily lysophospholipase
MRVMLAMLLTIAAIPNGVTDVARSESQEDTLPRRADLGAAIRPPSAATPARVIRISEDSPLYIAGLRANDDVVALDGRRFDDAIDFDRRMAALRGGQEIRLGVKRDSGPVEIRARLAPMVRERIKGLETVYTHISNPRGIRQRAIISRPTGSNARKPAILFVPWLSCDSVESPDGASPGIDELLHEVAQFGWVMLRVDKPGVGDSEGVCADTDLETELDGSRAALAWLRAHPWVDASKIVIMGHSFSGAFLPFVASNTPVAGYIVLNSWVRTWMERLLEFERLQAEASGMAPADVSERQRKLAEFYALFLEQQKTPREVIAERPELASVWNDAPEHQYGRSARFHHQLQRINAARAWSAVSVLTLAMWSDADVVMHRVDHERLVAMVNRNRPGAAELVVVPGADHGLAARGADGRAHLPAMVPGAIQKFLDRVQAGAASSQ